MGTREKLRTQILSFCEFFKQNPDFVKKETLKRVVYLTKMAKSLRSKWKRKMKAVKRVRYGEKEAKVLNKIVEGAKQRREEMEKEHQPKLLGEGYVLRTPEEGNDSNMEVTDGKKASAVNGKTLKNEHGNYPVWVSKRKIAQIKTKKNKTTKHVEGKVLKQKGVVRKRRF